MKILSSSRLKYLAAAAILMLAGAPAFAARQAPEAPSPSVPVRLTVTVASSKSAAQITRDDILVLQGKNRLPVTEWLPARGKDGALQLAIVIDEGVGTRIANQLTDVRNFINSLGPEAKVGVFYARNGIVYPTSQFTSDHQAAAKSVRLPLGQVGAYASIFFSLDDLMKRWPASSDRREVLLIGDGYDYLNGPFSPYPDSTIQKAQKEGIVIHTIYAAESGRARRNLFLLNVGQSNLGRLADETGGQAFFQGTLTPIAFQPYLNELRGLLGQQYWLTFQAPQGKKGGFQSVRIATEINGVELTAPDMVYVPGPDEKMKK